MNTIKPLLTIVLFFSLASSSQGQENNSISLPIAGLNNSAIELRIKTFDSLYAKNDPKIAGGFGFAIIDNGMVICKKAYGFADVENSVPFTTSTICDFASISKQFTGFAFARLISDGILSLDDDIRKYLPEMPDYGVKITVGQLLGHTSGIRDFVPLLKLSGHHDGDVISDEYLMKLIFNQKSLNFNPGDQHLYSNSGYFLLAHILSKASGAYFPDWIQQNILIPLGMESTRYLKNPGEIIESRASCYIRNSDGVYQNIPDNLSAAGSSSLFSSLDDMTKWAMNLITQNIGGREIFGIMTEPAQLNNGERIAYNFGLETGLWNGHKYLRHGGSWAGFLSDIICFPEEKAGIILISNRDPLEAQVTNPFLEALFNIDAETGLESGIPINADKPKMSVKKEILDTYTGEYVNKINEGNYIYQFAKVRLTPENLIFHTSRARNNRLYAETERKFFIVGADNKYEFQCDEKGESTKVIANLEGKEYIFTRIYPLIRNKTEVGELLGEYYSEELNTTYFIRITDNQLMSQSLLNEDVILSWVEPNIYVSNKYWFREVAFTRGENGRIEGFNLQTDNGNITKTLFFMKK